MLKYNYFFIILSLLVIGATIYGFSLIGSPFAQKSKNDDTQRLSHFSSISNSINRYYQKNKKLPSSLRDLVPDYLTKLPQDPTANQPYDFKSIDATSYQLCATFATDTKGQDDSYSISDTKHLKGYDCLPYKISSYYINSNLSPTPNLSLLTTYGTIDSVAVSDTNPRLIVLDTYRQTKIFDLTNAILTNQQGKKILLSEFKSGDKVIVDSTALIAKTVQNLSR